MVPERGFTDDNQPPNFALPRFSATLGRKSDIFTSERLVGWISARCWPRGNRPRGHRPRSQVAGSATLGRKSDIWPSRDR